MDSIHVRQRLRPIRYAFVVNEGNFGACLQAASLNAALWGGIYNPIVPLTPGENREGLLKAFDPDRLVNLADADLPADLAGRKLLNYRELVARKKAHLAEVLGKEWVS